jgi:hypothetical protein
MRIRTTKPEFWRSKTIAALPWDVRLVLKGLESYVDDNGVGKDDIALIAADVFPRDLSGNPRETLARLTEAISLLESSGLIARYVVADEDLLYIDKWKDLQRIDKPGRGRFPRPDGTMEYSEVVDRESYGNIRETVARAPEVVAPVTGEQGSRVTGEEKTPSPQAARMIETSTFREFWEAYPRRVGRAEATKAFARASKRVDPSEIVRGAQRFGSDPNLPDDKNFIPHPTTWLNQGRWEDEPLPPRIETRLRPTGTDRARGILELGASLMASAGTELGELE